jgi:23S rRNA (pseudouridine1915-N3)-methyltransferase
MQIRILSVGKPARLLDAAIHEYEQRAGRYWKLQVVVVKPETASRNRAIVEIQAAEADRLRAAASGAADAVALTREGSAWSSSRLARYLEARAVQGSGDVAFLIGGAYGLHASLLGEVRHRISLSSMTMPHDLARLVLAEQLYRAGTIVRGEPYHKG